MKMHTPEYKQWLLTLKVGDTVCVWKLHGQSYLMAEIRRTTATQAVCMNDDTGRQVRFRFSDGKIIGHSYRYVEPVTEATQKANSDAELRQWFQNMRQIKDVPLRVIEAMKAAYVTAIKETPTS